MYITRGFPTHVINPKLGSDPKDRQAFYVFFVQLNRQNMIQFIEKARSYYFLHTKKIKFK